MVNPLPQDPFAAIRAFTQPRRNQLAGLASGLLSGNDWGPGLAAGFAQAAQGRQADDAYAATQKADAMRQEQLQKTISYLRTQPGGNTWADAVEGGMVDPQDAFKGWYEESQGTGQKPIEVNGQLVDPKTFKVLGDYRTPETSNPLDAPSGFQPDPNKPGALTYIPGGPQDPSVRDANKPQTEGQRRNAQLATVAEPLLKAVEDNWETLRDGGNQVLGANTPFGSPGFALTSPEYQKAQTAIRTIAQSYLYSVSGAAATDAETQKIVDSVTPRFGESKDSADQKKALLRRYVESIKAAAGSSSEATGVASPTAVPNIDSILTKYGL